MTDDFEKLGVFYLGRRFDLAKKALTDDLVLYSRLRSGGPLKEVLETAPMGELAALKSLRRLHAAGMFRVEGGSPGPRAL